MIYDRDVRFIKSLRRAAEKGELQWDRELENVIDTSTGEPVVSREFLKESGLLSLFIPRTPNQD